MPVLGLGHVPDDIPQLSKKKVPKFYSTAIENNLKSVKWKANSLD